MKRLVITLALLLFPAISFAGQAGAVPIFKNCGQGSAPGTGNPAVCQDVGSQGTNTNPVIHVLKIAIDVISLIVGIAAVIGVVVSGLRLVIANGDSNSIASARSGLLYSLIGIAIVLSAQAIVVFVLDHIT